MPQTTAGEYRATAPADAAARPLRVVYLSDSPVRTDGAAGVHVLATTRHMHRQGVEVVLVVPRGEEAVEEPFEVRQLALPGAVTSFFYQAALLARLPRLLRAGRVDAVYARQSAYLFVPGLLCRAMRVPFVTEVNGTNHEEVAGSARSALARALWRAANPGAVLERISYGCAARIVTVTPGLAGYLRGKFPSAADKVVVVPNGVDVGTFCAEGCTGGSRPGARVGYVGGLTAWQGLEFVVRAWPAVRDEVPDAELVLVGGGEQEQELRRLAADLGVDASVRFVGPRPHEEVPELLRSFDVGVAYYVRDRSGLHSSFKVLEYLAAGVPVVASDNEDVLDAFGGAVATVPAEDSEALAVELAGLLLDAGRRGELAARGRELVREAYSWEACTRRVLAEVRTALGARARR
ncbi:glycosyltransferase family 4 protein [Kineococcus indalonis]|uniref:glycosyltransferase family 4 protein n=1 Tax=Kineococcus indalonis TaxID=2696566 RepID=UPI00141221A2|nr:glycosyltransferase family 4 protein [Kineococcus indalonis]NAZ85057.1 glycosyltransferase [Kineococcus indalonis]